MPMPPKKKKERACIPEPLPPCPPPPDICLESGLTPAEKAVCYEKERWKSPVSRAVKKFHSFTKPPIEKCRIKEKVVEEEDDPCSSKDDVDDTPQEEEED
ncbi:unnamed protein product [Arctia plantaginis]|uniref:Uncharacterized protein n=1 Tax=Arctia plantaginis TaxID=874455 RepID=A0A8S1AAI9_ARCPL|nr:unnamed protein product [Arctia plantaginis]